MKHSYSHYMWVIQANPVTAIVETFKYAFTGVGVIDWANLLYSFIFSIVVLLIGIVVFNKVQKNFMDVI